MVPYNQIYLETSLMNNMDFSCISPLEFEELSSDILTHILKKEARTFKEGRDGGIDIEYRDSHCFIMGQCKRYSKSEFSKLIHDLKKEVEKVKKQKPDSYYVFTTMELSEQQIKEVFQLFTPYMTSTDCVFDGHRIDSFLKKEEAEPIRKKNIKIWIDSFNTLNEIFKPDLSKDVDELMCNITDHKNIYVQTSFFREAMDILDKKRVLLVTGKAGSGKSTLCEMALLGLKADKPSARVIYSQMTDYKDLILSLDGNCLCPEIVYIDDFLGQSCLEIASSSLSSIKMLISYIERHRGKYLIINSRIQVLNEVQNENSEIYDKLKTVGFIDLGARELTTFEKARILYSHIVSSKIGAKRIAKLVNNDYYYSIIKHENYLPRIIQYLFNQNQYPENEEEYIPYVENTLKHPEKVWENEYNKKIYPEDRMLLQTLYSVSDYRVDFCLLKKAFNKQEGSQNFPKVDFSKASLFENSIKRLNGGFISLSVDANKKTVQVSNPSINDFLKTIFENKSPSLVEDLMERSTSFDQLYRLKGENLFDPAFLTKKHQEGFTYSADVFNPHLYYQAVFSIASLKIDRTERFKKLFVDGLSFLSEPSSGSYTFFGRKSIEQTIVKLFKNDIFEYYPFLVERSVFNKVLNVIRLRCSGEGILIIYNNCSNLDLDERTEIFELAREEAICDAYYSLSEGDFLCDIDENDYIKFDGDDEGSERVVDYSAIAEEYREVLIDCIYESKSDFDCLKEVDEIEQVTRSDIEDVLDDICDYENIVENYYNEGRCYRRGVYSDLDEDNGNSVAISKMFKALLDGGN